MDVSFFVQVVTKPVGEDELYVLNKKITVYFLHSN